MDDLPEIRNEPETLEAFRDKLRDTDLELLMMLCNSSTNSAIWLTSVRDVLVEPSTERVAPKNWQVKLSELCEIGRTSSRYYEV